MTAATQLAEVMESCEMADSRQYKSDILKFQAQACALIRHHGPEIARAMRVLAAYDGAATGECVEIGDDDEGQPRATIHSTREELRKGRSVAFKRVRLVPEVMEGE